MKVTSSLRRSDPQQSNELPVGRSAWIFQKGFVFDPLDCHLDSGLPTIRPESRILLPATTFPISEETCPIIRLIKS
jgi:hypothetical protein